jgi:hypothetical protein
MPDKGQMITGKNERWRIKEECYIINDEENDS